MQTRGGYMADKWQARLGGGLKGHKADIWLMRGGHVADTCGVWRRRQISGLRSHTWRTQGGQTADTRRTHGGHSVKSQGGQWRTHGGQARQGISRPAFCFLNCLGNYTSIDPGQAPGRISRPAFFLKRDPHSEVLGEEKNPTVNCLAKIRTDPGYGQRACNLNDAGSPLRVCDPSWGRVSTANMHQRHREDKELRQPK